MTEFVFITTSDIHISDNGPPSRRDDFKATMLHKISQMRVACNKLNADGAIIAGDLYNIKTPSKNSHNLNIELINEFQQFNCPIYMIEGNHDLTGNQLNSLDSQPLGVLFADKTLIQLRHQILEKDGIKISLVGIPYQEDIDLNSLNIPEKTGYVCQLCAMHIYATLKPGFLFKTRLYGYNELSRLSPDIFILGHYHIDQGIYEQDGKYFVNIGSMSRGVLAEEDINHQPQIGFIKIAIEDNNVSYTLRTIKLKVKPANEIFNLLKREEEKREQKEIQVFIEKLITETARDPLTSASLDSLLDKMEMEKAVKERVLYYIENAIV